MVQAPPLNSLVSPPNAPYRYPSSSSAEGPAPHPPVLSPLSLSNAAFTFSPPAFGGGGGATQWGSGTSWMSDVSLLGVGSDDD
jgi:hypothetical protein